MKALKVLTLTLALLATSTVTALAADCVDANGNEILNQPEVFQAMIEKSGSCYEAQQLAEACAWGSSLDVTTAGLAYEVCEKEMSAAKPARSLLKILKSMKDTCTNKYKDEEGSLYRSINAYCHLSAISWANGIAQPN